MHSRCIHLRNLLAGWGWWKTHQIQQFGSDHIFNPFSTEAAIPNMQHSSPVWATQLHTDPSCLVLRALVNQYLKWICVIHEQPFLLHSSPEELLLSVTQATHSGMWNIHIKFSDLINTAVDEVDCMVWPNYWISMNTLCLHQYTWEENLSPDNKKLFYDKL